MKVIVALLCAAVLGVGAWLFARSSHAPSVTSAEWLLAAVALAAAVARWRIMARRRQRQKLQELRDSALW
ncbi:MAG TPA: hypothetical protein VKD22_12645 [Ramlibacter sp.]|nr:hypothetical protein [Ramlibacter sp.]